MNDTTRRDRKSTQRGRLLDAMIDLAARDGYANTSIARVIADAGVSRPTFYDYFTDKDDCFLTALTNTQAQLVANTQTLIENHPPEQALQTAIQTITEFANTQPGIARLLMNEPMVCGIRALDVRDHGIREIARAVEAAHELVGAATPLPDISSRVLLGGVDRLLAAHIRRGEPLAGLLEDLLAWTRSYERPVGEHRWRALEPLPSPPPSPFLGDVPLRAPMALPPGRPRVSAEEVAENHRQRILFAAAQVAAEKGYADATIADVTALAGLDGRAFRRLFADKQEVYAAVHELHFQHVVAITAGAFFAGASWPERVWEAGRAFTQSIEQNPSLAHVSFVEFYAGGPIALERNSELLQAFTVFLQEGYQYERSRSAPSPVALEAIAATNFETIYQQIRASANPRLSGFLPHSTYLNLAPFLGPTDANLFIEEKLSAPRPDLQD